MRAAVHLSKHFGQAHPHDFICANKMARLVATRANCLPRVHLKCHMEKLLVCEYAYSSLIGQHMHMAAQSTT